MKPPPIDSRHPFSSDIPPLTLWLFAIVFYTLQKKFPFAEQALLVSNHSDNDHE
jgi:hypothetical protein